MPEGLKGGLWVFRKSQKISTASDQYFLSYVIKTTGGGGGKIDPPPPAGGGLRRKQNAIKQTNKILNSSS